MQSRFISLYLLIILICFGVLLNTEKAYTAGVTSGNGTNITATDSTIFTGTGTPGDPFIITPQNVSGNYALSTYQFFDLGAGDFATLNPNGALYYINRLDSGYTNPFHINGTLTSSAHLIFINPYGIYVGPDASINTGALTLTTASSFKIGSTNNLGNLANSLITPTLPVGLPSDLSSSVIYYEGIATLPDVPSNPDTTYNILNPDAIISNEGMINADYVNIVAGKIDNSGTIGNDTTTQIVNLVTADIATYNGSTSNTYNTTEITTAGMGGINLQVDSQVMANDVRIRSHALNPNAGITDVAINVAGLVTATAIGNESGTLQLVSESSNSNKIVRIAKNAPDSISRLLAAGSDANIYIKGQNIDIFDGTTDASTISIVKSDGTLNMQSFGNTTIDARILSTGNMFIQSDGSINVVDTASVGNTVLTSGGLLDMLAGNTIDIQNGSTIESGNNLNISTTSGGIYVDGILSNTGAIGDIALESGDLISILGPSSLSSDNNITLEGLNTIDVSSTSSLTAKNIDISNQSGAGNINIFGSLTSTGTDYLDEIKVASAYDLIIYDTAALTSQNRTNLTSANITNIVSGASISAGDALFIDAEGSASINGTIAPVSNSLKVIADDGITVTSALEAGNNLELLIELPSSGFLPIGDVNVYNTLTTTNAGSNIVLAGNNLNINSAGDIDSAGSLNMISKNTTLAGATASSVNTYVVTGIDSGNGLNLQSGATLTSSGNTYIETPLIDLTGGNISSTNGDVYIGHIPVGSFINGYRQPLVPGGTITLTMASAADDITASGGTGSIFFGAGDGTTTFNNIMINGTSFTTPEIINQPNFSLYNLQDNLIASNLDFFWKLPTTSVTDVITNNTTTINQVIATTLPPPPPTTSITTPTLVLAPPPPPPPTTVKADGSAPPSAYTEANAESSAISLGSDSQEPSNISDSSSTTTGTQDLAYNTETQSQETQVETTTSNTQTEGTQDNTSITGNTEEPQAENNEKDVNNEQKVAENNKEKTDETEQLTKLVEKQGILKINKDNYKNYNGEKFVNTIASHSSPDNEFTADAKGTEFAKESGYHPAGMAGYLVSVNDLEKRPENNNKVNELFSYRHPKTLDRLVNVKNEMMEYQKTNELQGLTNQQAFSKIQSLIH